jgi:hypothetical protein
MQLLCSYRYIPSTTLEAVWPNLTPGNKLSIQQSLQGIFTKIRSLKLQPGGNIGGVQGEGVRDYFDDRDYDTKRPKTLSAFEDVQFSDPGDIPPTPTFTAFLRSLLPPTPNMCSLMGTSIKRISW